MGKGNTALSLQMAINYLQEKLPKDIMRGSAKKAKGKIDSLFPFMYTSRERQKEREQLWQQIGNITSTKTETICKTALITFSGICVPYSALMPSVPDTFDSDQVKIELRQLRDFVNQNIRLMDLTARQLQKEIHYREVVLRLNNPTAKYQINHNLDGVIKLYRDFLNSVKEIYPLDHLSPHSKVIHGLLAHWRDDHRIEIAANVNPSNLPFRALALVVFIILWAKSTKKKQSARLTAAILNEYFFHNSIYENPEELTESKVLNLWNFSKFNGEELRNKIPQDLSL